MSFKIVADSSSNLFELKGAAYACVPLKINTQEKEYVDTAELDVSAMVEELRHEKGPSRTSCPNTQEWLDAFGDADGVFAVAITASLSGSYSAAVHAGEMYKEEHPERKVCVINSLSAGPELELIVERIRDGVTQGQTFEEIEEDVRAYMNRTHLTFMLRSLTNLARNGRVSHAAAGIAGVLGICVVGKASDEGTLQQMHKCRGEKRAVETMYAEMKKMGFCGRKLRIAHCQNAELADQLAAKALAEYPETNVIIRSCSALCSFYAEKGGLLVGFDE